MEGCVGEKVVLLLGEERPVGRVEHIDYQVQTVHWRPAVERKKKNFITKQEAKPWTALLVQQFSNIVKFCQNAFSLMWRAKK